MPEHLQPGIDGVAPCMASSVYVYSINAQLKAVIDRTVAGGQRQRVLLHPHRLAFTMSPLSRVAGTTGTSIMLQRAADRFLFAWQAKASVPESLRKLWAHKGNAVFRKEKENVFYGRIAINTQLWYTKIVRIAQERGLLS